MKDMKQGRRGINSGLCRHLSGIFAFFAVKRSSLHGPSCSSWCNVWILFKQALEPHAAGESQSKQGEKTGMKTAILADLAVACFFVAGCSATTRWPSDNEPAIDPVMFQPTNPNNPHQYIYQNSQRQLQRTIRNYRSWGM
jgi:hypothetical protein